VTDFLYPFIDGDERDAGPLLLDLTRSAEAKAAESQALRTTTLDGCDAMLAAAAAAIALRVAAGGRLLTFGNGGSATDAAAMAALFRAPPDGRPMPARSLVGTGAVLTALANDVGFDVVFSRQLIAAARPTDVAVGFSTSGNSVNLLEAFAEAKRRGLLTVGFAGYDGGQMAASPAVDHCLVVASDSVHRIQESQAALVDDLWRRVQRASQ
jgi:D-sedoheptulose 7-phosphate isomerase